MLDWDMFHNAYRDLSFLDMVLTSALNRSVADVELYMHRTRLKKIQIREDTVDFHSGGEVTGVCARVLAGGLAVAYSTRPDAKAIGELIVSAKAGAQRAGVSDLEEFVRPEETLADCDIYDPKGLAMPDDDKIALLREIAGRITGLQPGIRTEGIYYVERASAIAIVNSAGVRVCYPETYFGIYSGVIGGGEDRQTIVWEYSYARHFSDLDLNRLTNMAVERALVAQPLPKPAAGKYNVLFMPICFMEILMAVAKSVCAHNLKKDSSFLRDYLGKQIAAPVMTVIDDGLYPRGLLTKPVDDEGSPSRTTPVITAGVLTELLHDSVTARSMGTKSTGNASKVGQHPAPPQVFPSNFYVKPGEISRDRLLRKMGRGLWVQDYLNARSIDHVTGDFSLPVIGTWIEDGQPVGPVRDIILSGNLYALMQNVQAVGADLMFYPVDAASIGSPSVLVSDVFLVS